jgi:hypothetical protein
MAAVDFVFVDEDQFDFAGGEDKRFQAVSGGQPRRRCKSIWRSLV